MRDFRYCKCQHKADDHNSIHLGCFKCDCQQWTPDFEKFRIEKEKQRQVDAFYDGSQRTAKPR